MWRRTAIESIEWISRRSASLGVFPIRCLSFSFSALASVSEKVVSKTRASAFSLAKCTARCNATIVLPVPAEPETRAGPLKSFSTSSCWSGWRNTVHFSHGASSARSSSSVSTMERNLRCASGCSNGLLSGEITIGALGDPPTAISMRASAASAGRWSDNSNIESSSDAFTSANHSGGTPYSSNLSSSKASKSRGLGGGVDSTLT